MDKTVTSTYIPPNFANIVNEWDQGGQMGEPPRVQQMDPVFAWMRGFINGWYGYANDGKGTFFDFMSILKSKHDDWKWCVYKQEDMSSVKVNDGVQINADRIYKNLAWMLTGITPYEHYSKKHKMPKLTLDQLQEAIEWIEAHFFVIYPNDRRYENVLDDFKFMYEKFGIDGFLIDPFKSLILPETGRTDKMMDDLFISAKEFSLRTNTSFNFIAHPKSQNDVKENPKDPISPYKVVNQFMIAGGAAWDNNMDSQYSIYRPDRHINPADTKVHFHNLKQRQAELVGCNRGKYTQINFDPHRKRYFFDGICPLDGSAYDSTVNPFQTGFGFDQSNDPMKSDTVPF